MSASAEVVPKASSYPDNSLPYVEAGSFWHDATVYELRPEIVYGDILARQAGQLPEVAEHQAAILKAGQELIDTYQIQREFFENPAGSLVFTAIAKRWAAAGEQEQAKARAERNFLFNILVILDSQTSPMLKAAKENAEKDDPPLDDEQIVGVYDKYTDHKLSQELQRAIGEGLLDDVKAGLQVTPENETPYDIRVLSIDPLGQHSNGIAPAITPEEKQARQGLIDRAEQMARDLGREGSLVHNALAWVTRLPGNKLSTLCLTAPLVKKLLYPELTAHNDFYQNYGKDRDLALLGHEYVHTQDRVNIGGESVVGVNLEELRAEHFSGNRGGYLDVKGFFNDLAVVTGFSVTQLFDGKTKGGSEAELYTAMAEHLGLDGMLEVLLAVPTNYRTSLEANRFLISVATYLGSFDHISQRLMEREIAKGNHQALQARATKAATAVNNGGKHNRVIWANRRKMLGLNHVTELISQRCLDLR